MNKHFLRSFSVFLVIITGLLALSISFPIQVQAAWLSPWLNRTPVTISNTGGVLTDYQVRISLDNTFNYSGAKSDGSDIRFTALDGVTLLPYWMESWNTGVSATFWVKVPSVSAGGDSVTVYLYYGNSSATSASDGYATFYSFDDFEGSPWTAWTKKGGPGTFIQSTDQAKRGTHSGKLVTDATTGSTIFSKASSLPGTNFVQEWELYDDLDFSAFKMVRANYAIPSGQIGVGVWTGASGSNYSFHSNGYGYTPTTVARTRGWHKMAIRVTADGSANFFVDGSSTLGTLAGLPTTFNRFSVEGIPDGPTTYYVDDIRVRKYASPEPTAAIGQGGQPSVDMAVVVTDSPDPVKVSQPLTYQIAVNNYGDLDATNVLVTDVLPGGITFGSVTTTLGACNGTSTITCDLGTVTSGGSASITIQVTSPTSIGTLSNTATISSLEADFNLANNTSTTTTTVGNPVVYVVNGVDTEPFDDHQTTPEHRPFNLTNFIPSTTTYIGPLMASSFRTTHVDSFGTPFKMTWYVEMDNYINNGVYADGTPMNYLTIYNTFVSNYGTELATWGDELAYHHHFWAWNGTSWAQGTYEQQALDGPYDEHNNALDRMILDAGFFPTDFRSGWLTTSNQLQGWVEKWMLADFSSNWSTPWTPYHPSSTNYTQVGSMNHWIARCDGGPSSASVTAAFAEAATTGKPVIYCWYGHDRENLSGYINTLQPLLTSASTSTSVPFRYATSKEAMQAVMGTTDTTPPALTVAKGSGDAFNITANEAVWNNAPYVTARYIAPSGLKYIHTPATAAGTNVWTVMIPDQQTWTTTIPGEMYPLIGVTASSEKPGNPAPYAIDGNESTYWDSEALPQWIRVDLGSIQPVPMLTVHFYDGDSRTYTYSIDASTNGTDWTQIVSSTTVHGLATHQFSPAISMQFARINVTAQSINNFAHIYEIKLYKTTPSTTSETGDLQQVGVGAGDLSGNTSVASNILQPMADLSLTKTSTPPSGRVGNNLTYNLTVTNHGPSPATAVQVTDNLPAGLSFVSSSGACTGTSSVVCNLGDLANGANTTVNIVVNPTAEGTYVNNANVTATSTDLNPANNIATLSTVVGNPVVYIVNAVDTEAFNNHPTTPQHVLFDLHNFIKGQSTYIGPLMADTFRNANRDSFGTPFKMTWYVEMDNFINNGVYPDGTAMNYLTLYNTFVNNFTPELTTWGDELAYHHHFTVWNGTAWIQDGHQHATDGQYDEHNNALDRMVLDANFFPTDFRSGWLNESNQLQAWVENWMLSDDSGSGWATGWIPYHPSATDYTQAGSMNHWMVNCPGGSIDTAFAQAASSGKPVIYCWYGHDREDLSNYISGIQSSATSASVSSGVPFRYATAKEALQAVMGTTDTTPPALNVSHGSGDTFNITSNEAVWNNAPYVAARYLTASGLLKYMHTPAISAGTNSWTAQVPATQSYTTTIPPEKYPVTVSATHSDSAYPPGLAVDGNDTTYWDSGLSNGLPQSITVDLGSVQPVPMLTVHFYDLDGRSYTYSIEASDDGTTWREIVTSRSVSGLATHPFSPAENLRYARVNVTVGSASAIAHIFEFTLYKTTTTTTIEETGNLQQVGVGALDLSGNSTVASNIVLALADLSITKTASPASLRLGAGNLTYTLTVTNHGPSTATGVQVTDTLPVGMNFLSASPGCNHVAGVVTCSLGNLANGASTSVNIVVTPTAENTYVNTATVSAVETDLTPANNSASVTNTVGNPLVYVVIAIDTEADNNHPMGSLHTTFDVHNYQRAGGTTCPAFLTEYSDNGTTWTAYAPTGATVFNFQVTPTGQTDPTTSFTCGTNNAFGLDDYARAVQFTVPSTGSYDVGLQLSVTGTPPDTIIYIVPDTGGNPDLSTHLSMYTAQAATIASANGEYVVIGSDLTLTGGVPYWWVASKQASGDDSNQFAVYQGGSGSTNTFAQIMDSSFRSATTDSHGNSFKMSWFMEMDNFINNGFYANGQPMNYLTLYNELMNNWGAEVHNYGDEIAYHHHFMYWDGSSWQMGGHEQALTGPYDEHNNALDRMVLDAGFFPTDFRAGWLNNDNQLQAWVEKWMLADVGGAGWGGTGWEPYHPSATDYTQVGAMNHWMANCPGGPSQASVDSAFAQAAADNRPVILCWYMHERDDMRGLVAAANGYLHNANTATGIPFEYITAQKAMQAVIGTTDTTSPILTLTPTGADNYQIASNETLWGSAPYVAARYGEGTNAVYVHLAATPGASNTWTVTVPSTNATLPLEQVGTGAIDLSGNSAVASNALHLQTGWNLISFNLHPADTAPGSVLASIAGSYDLVYAWDATGGHSGSGNWMSYAPSVPIGNTLTNLTEQMGFWIHITADNPVTLYVTGSLSTTTSIPLPLSPAAGGWNLVGFPTGNEKALPDVLSNYGMGTNYSLVYAYHIAETDPWKMFDRTAPLWVNDLSGLTPGWGYWVQVTAPTTWSVSYP